MKSEFIATKSSNFQVSPNKNNNGEWLVESVANASCFIIRVLRWIWNEKVSSLVFRFLTCQMSHTHTLWVLQSASRLKSKLSKIIFRSKIISKFPPKTRFWFWISYTFPKILFKSVNHWIWPVSMFSFKHLQA